MRRLFLIALAAATLGAFARDARAQAPAPAAQRDSSVVFVLRTRDGSTIVGRVTEQSADSLRFATTGGTLTLARADVSELRPVRRSELRRGDYWFPDPNRTRLFFAPTGRMLGSGEGYFSNTDLFVQQVAVGLGSRFTVGGGFTLLPTGDMAAQAYYVTPKLGLYQSERTNVAIGALAGWIPIDDGTNFGVVYGVATQGGRDASVTGGVGWAYGNGNFDNEPVAMLGGTLRVGPRLALLTENYGTRLHGTDFSCDANGCAEVRDGYLGTLSMYGLRFLGDRISVDLALMNFHTRDIRWIFPGIPYVGFAVNF